jgi:tetratricopeptide (TPR) repeat protein
MNKINKHRESVEKEPLNNQPPSSIKNPGLKLLYIFLALLPVILVFAIYSNTLEGPYIFDDGPNITDNYHIRLTQISLKGLMDAGFKSIGSNRPIPNISFALNFYFDQYNVFGYHLVNIIIHLLAGLFLFLLLRETLRISLKIQAGSFPESIKPSLLAYIVTFVWLVHPLHTESVTYIVQRMNSMASMFYILSMWFYVKGRLTSNNRRWGFWAGCLISGLLAFGSKEMTATLPIFIFLYEWYFFQDLDTAWIKKKILPVTCVLALFALLTLLFQGSHPLLGILGGYRIRPFTLTQRLFTELRAVMLYISLIFFPHPMRLNLDYDFPLSLSLVDPVTTLFSFVFLFGIFVVAIVSAKKERLISFCILWFLGNLAIESSVIPLELVYEHRTYLPSMFFVLLIIVLFYRFVPMAKVRTGIICIIIIIFSLWAYQRNTVWSDEGSLQQDIVMKSPYKARCYLNLGIYYLRNSKYEKGLEQLYKALELPNAYCPDLVYGNIGYGYLKMRQYEKAIYYLNKAIGTVGYNPKSNHARIFLGAALETTGRVSEAIVQYREAVKEDPTFQIAQNYLGKCLAKNGMIEEGKTHIMEALRLDPACDEAYNNIANIYLQEGKTDVAINYYKEALAHDPLYADAYYNLGIVMAEQGRDIEAIDYYSHAILISKTYSSARKNLAVLFYRRGELQKAIEQCRQLQFANLDDAIVKQILAEALDRKNKIDTKISQVRNAVERSPQDPKLYYQLGELLRMEGNFDDAIKSYEKAISIKPGFSQAYQQIAIVYSLKGDNNRAGSYLRKSIDIDPNNPDSYYNLACLYAKMNNVEESSRWLKIAVEKGFHNIELLKTDRDLTNIRNTAYYKELIQRGG